MRRCARLARGDLKRCACIHNPNGFVALKSPDLFIIHDRPENYKVRGENKVLAFFRKIGYNKDEPRENRKTAGEPKAVSIVLTQTKGGESHEPGI